MEEVSSDKIKDFFDAATSLFLKISGSPFINLGYWTKKTSSIKTAQTRLVLEFGRFCGIKRNFKILDTGPGTGAQDILWMKSYKPKLIHGINISPYQVRMANDEARRLGLAPCIKYESGDACKLPAKLKNFDCVTGLECAHLFCDIPSFFSSSHRALKKNGRICLANLTYRNSRAFDSGILAGIYDEFKGVDLTAFAGMPEKFVEVEKQNAKYFDELLETAARKGFRTGRVIDITPHVKPFYGVFKKRITGLLSKSSSSSEKNSLTMFLVSLYLRKVQFDNDSLGYFFIEFKKS